MTDVPPEIAARIAALETKVSELYQLLDAVEPSQRDAVASSIPSDIAELARTDRTAAIKLLRDRESVSTLDAMTRIDGFLRG